MMKLTLVLGLMLLSGCGVKDSLDATNATISKTNGSLESMSSDMKGLGSSFKKQALMVALSDMLKPENTENLLPPTGMLIGGNAFAANMDADDLVKLGFLWMTEVEKSFPDESKRVSGQFPPEVVKEFDHKKLVKITGLSIIAGLSPQSVIDDMIKIQVEGQGRYVAIVNPLLMLRSSFIKNMLLDGDLLGSKISNLGMLTEAVKQASALEFIVKLPFASKIGILTTGMLDPDDNISDKLDLNQTKAIWKRLRCAVDNEVNTQGLSEEQYKKLQELRETIYGAMR
jgi:hypothetical protein